MDVLCVFVLTCLLRTSQGGIAKNVIFLAPKPNANQAPRTARSDKRIYDPKSINHLI